MTTINKPKTDWLNALIHQTNGELSRALRDSPFISNSDYTDFSNEVHGWITLSLTGDLYGTNQDNSTFQFAGIGTDPIYPR